MVKPIIDLSKIPANFKTSIIKIEELEKSGKKHTPEAKKALKEVLAGSEARRANQRGATLLSNPANPLGIKSEDAFVKESNVKFSDIGGTQDLLDLSTKKLIESKKTK